MLQLSFFMFSFREHKSEFLLLVLSLAPRGLSPGTPVFPSPEEPTLRNFNSMWNAGTSFNEFLRTPKCSVGKQITNLRLQIRSCLNDFSKAHCLVRV